MSKFKVGDKVVVVDKDGGGGYVVGETCIIERMIPADGEILVYCKGKRCAMYDFRFKLAEDTPPVDLKTLIKPFMRVFTKNGCWWVATEWENGVVLVDPVQNSWNIIKNPNDYIYDEYEIMAVYDKPNHIRRYFDLTHMGTLLWQRKSEKQLKIEALEKELAELKASK